MRRTLLTKLQDWKALPERKPVLLDGARQVGKTYLIERLFGKATFKRVIKLDFMREPTLATLFAESLDPTTLIGNIELSRNITFDPATDLLFFDEVGECQPAVNSLKFFAEEMPHIFLCASGSNIGLLDSFPVGKVHLLELFPMSFVEFLEASGQSLLLERYHARDRSQVVHDKLWELLLEYYYVGGMPEAVKHWFADQTGSPSRRVEQVADVHRGLLNGYLRDFGKYSGKVAALHVETVFRNIPQQLAVNIDTSVRRYRFAEVLPKKKRYQDLRGPIEWLEKTKLISRCYPLACQPEIPLASRRKDSVFKLFLLDVGLLGRMLDLPYSAQFSQNFSYKGYLAENFVQNELRTSGYYPTYSWNENTAEIEFLYQDAQGRIFPVEVKSGAKTKAKSLSAYRDRYQPAKTVKLVGTAGGTQDKQALVLPLYYAGKLDQFLAE